MNKPTENLHIRFHRCQTNQDLRTFASDLLERLEEAKIQQLNCIDAPKGRGFCDNCAEGDTDFCRYTTKPAVLDRIKELEDIVQQQSNIINTDEGVADVYAKNAELRRRLERVKGLAKEWEDGFVPCDSGAHYSKRQQRKCADELQAIINGDES